MHIISFLLLFLFQWVLSEKIIIEQLTSQYNSYTIQCRFTNQISFYHFTFDISLPFSYFTKSYLNQSEKLTATDPIMLNERTQEAYYITDTFSFYNTKISLNDFRFYVVESNRNILQSNSIGFGYADVDKEYSIIRRLYDEGKISRKIFAIGENQNLTPLYIGGIPSEVIQNYKNKILLKVDERHNKWGIKLKKINFGNIGEYNNTHYAYLGTENDRVFAPSEFISFLNKEIFAAYYRNSSCTFYDEYGSAYINCNCDAINDFPNMSLYIDDYVFVLDKNRSFIDIGRDNLCLFLIQQNNYDKYQWLFGFFFYKKYITSFDLDRKEIILYTNDTIINLNKGNNAEISKKIIYFIIFLLLIFICANAYIIIKN